MRLRALELGASDIAALTLPFFLPLAGSFFGFQTETYGEEMRWLRFTPSLHDSPDQTTTWGLFSMSSLGYC